MEDNEYILEMSSISKSFSGVKALDDVSFKVKKGDIHALLGANGAGKSTLMKILSGILHPDPGSGDILLDGERTVLSNPSDAQRKGISIVFQELAVLRDLSVLENIFLNREIVRGGFYNWGEMRKRARAIMEDLGIDYDLNTKVADMSIAQQQMVEITKAVSTQVKVLILDEPTSSLAEAETLILFDMIRKLKSRGVTIIYISHRLDEIFELCEMATILRDGKFIFTKPLSEVTAAELASTMIGREINSEFPRRKRQPSEDVILQLNNMTGRSRFSNISLELRRGEILGLAGLVGSGRTELGRAVYGEFPLASGTIIYEGKETVIRSSDKALSLGIAYATEDRKYDGILARRPVVENICLASLENYKKAGLFLSRQKESEAAAKEISALDIKVRGQDQEIQTLSGGNQQKVCLSKWLLVNPKILIFDEPTRGIDVGAKAEFYHIICDLADSGTSIIMISSEETELIGLCDRIVVLREGKKVTEMTPYPGCLDELSHYMFGLEYTKKDVEGTSHGSN